jgi:GMP synthase-like glutamine amidotransferase
MTVRVAFLQHSEWDVPGLLGERSRELGFVTTSFRADHGSASLPTVDMVDLLVVMGSAESVTDGSLAWIGHERRLVASAVEAGVPVLGVCFGGQLLAQVLGGTVSRAPLPEIGWRLLDTDDPARVPAGPWVVWHGDRFTAPPGADPVARTEESLHAFILRGHTGVQFHPEADRDIVGHWVADARAQGRLDTAMAEELLGGFGPDGRGPEEQARQLFDG